MITLAFFVGYLPLESINPPTPGRPHPYPHIAGKKVVTAQLIRDEDEVDGFGCYSYLLYSVRPSAGNLRDVAIFEELLSHPSEEELPDADLALLNRTGVPLLKRAENDAKDWIQKYDFGQSSQMLMVQQVVGTGPFIVSSKTRIVQATTKAKIAYLDLSDASTEESARAWVRHFVIQSEQPHAWATIGVQTILLRLHDGASDIGAVWKTLPNQDDVLKVLGIGK